MDQQPTLTVVIPCYRSGVGLTWQLESLIHQRSAPRREILLCDNGANPGLADRVRDLGILPNDVTIRVIDATDHRGAAYARNRGIAEAQADLLAFCDDDDLVHPDWCRLAVDLLADHPVVTGGIVVMDDIEMAKLDPAERRAVLEERTIAAPVRPAGRGSLGPALMGGNFAARRGALLAVRGFDAALTLGGEDNDLAYRLDRAGVPVVDAGGMSIIYARPSALRDRVRVRRLAGRALVEATSAREAWIQAAELRRPPVAELARAGGALAAMALGAKRRDWAGAADRAATAWGLTQGWVHRRLLGRRAPSSVGLGLEQEAQASEGSNSSSGIARH